MKRPTWVTVIGIIAIILGAFGVMGGVGNIMTPAVIEMQREMLGAMEGFAEVQPEFPSGMFRAFEQFLHIPPWVGSWFVVTGALKLLASGLVVLAAVYLLQLKQVAPRWFYVACGARLLVAVFELVPAFSGSLWGYSTMSNSFLSIVAFGALLLVAATSDKSAFGGAPATPPPA
jgi:hypothetical protein